MSRNPVSTCGGKPDPFPACDVRLQKLRLGGQKVPLRPQGFGAFPVRIAKGKFPAKIAGEQQA